VFARNCNSPSRQAYELLQLPSFPSGFGWMGVPGSNGIVTGFMWSIPSHFKIASTYCCCPMEMVFADQVILMPIILEGSPRSVVSHSVLMFCFVFSIRVSIVVNSNRSSTQMVMIAKPLPSCFMYVQGS